jgi:hypothetical protein
MFASLFMGGRAMAMIDIELGAAGLQSRGPFRRFRDRRRVRRFLLRIIDMTVAVADGFSVMEIA